MREVRASSLVMQPEAMLRVSGTHASRDELPVFERYNRVPGTRCNRIMTWLEQGLSDAEIARRVSRGGAVTTSGDIHVYRLVLEAVSGGAELPDATMISERAAGLYGRSAREQTPEQAARLMRDVLQLRSEGVSVDAIADRMCVPTAMVAAALDRAAKAAQRQSVRVGCVSPEMARAFYLKLRKSFPRGGPLRSGLGRTQEGERRAARREAREGQIAQFEALWAQERTFEQIAEEMGISEQRAHYLRSLANVPSRKRSWQRMLIARERMTEAVRLRDEGCKYELIGYKLGVSAGRAHEQVIRGRKLMEEEAQGNE